MGRTQFPVIQRPSSHGWAGPQGNTTNGHHSASGAGSEHQSGTGAGSSSVHATPVTLPALSELQNHQEILRLTIEAADARLKSIEDGQYVVNQSKTRGQRSSRGAGSRLTRSGGASRASEELGDTASPAQASTPTVAHTGVLNAKLPPNHNSNLLASQPRGTKRSRYDSESSLSPTSSTSTSSIDLPVNASKPTTAASTASLANSSNSTAGGTQSRASSPATSLGANGRATSKAPPPTKSAEGRIRADSNPLGLQGISSSASHAIPGLSGPVPVLPGFTKKKQKQTSPSPAPHPQPAKQSSLPPPPASLPPKPQTSLDSRPSTPTRSDFPRHDSPSTTSRPSKLKDAAASGGSHLKNDLDVPLSPGPLSMKDKGRSVSPLPAKLQSSATDTEKSGTEADASNDILKAASSSAALQPPKFSFSSPPHDDDEDVDKKPIIDLDAFDGADSKAATPSTGALAETTGSSLLPSGTAPLPLDTPSPIPPPPPLSPKLSATVTSANGSPHPPIARKVLPPSATTPSANRIIKSPKPSPSPQPLTSRPGTPLAIARKNLPITHSQRPSPAPSVAVDLTKEASPSNLASPSAQTAGLPPRKQSATPLPNGAVSENIGTAADATTATLSAEELAAAKEAKRKRKEEKRKRKLAAMASNSSINSLADTRSASGTPNASPVAVKVNGKAHHDNNLHPNKLRRIEESQSPLPAAGLKVKLNGFTLNRQKSATPSGDSFAHPLLPVKKAVSVPGIADDFTLPAKPLIPVPPPIVVPQPTARKQADVDEDFDYAKPASQVPYSTFSNWVNDYLRSYGEDDIAFLAAKPEDPAAFVVPPLGAHYQDTWAAMDAEVSGDSVELPPASTALVPPPLKRFRTQNINDDSLPTENVYLGPLSERVMSAFLNTNVISSMMEGMMSGLASNTDSHDESHRMDIPESGDVLPQPSAMTQITSPQMLAPRSFSVDHQDASPSIREMDAVDFEARLTRELAFLGAIPPPTRPALPPPPKKSSELGSKEAKGDSLPDSSSSVDWAGREDDEISSALRACQRLLRQQVTTNDLRKAKLAELVRDRIAYQEYEHLRDGLEAVVEGAWNKRQRAAQRKAHKDKKEKDKKEKDKDKEAAATLAQNIAALNQPQPLSASLISALTKRRNLVDGFAHLFPEGGLILPETSVYEALEIKNNIIDEAPESLDISN